MFLGVRIGGQEMLAFRKIWRALFFWNTSFEIRSFAWFPTSKNCSKNFFQSPYYTISPYKKKWTIANYMVPLP